MAAATVFVCVVLFVCVCAMCNAGSEVQGPIHHDQKYEQKRDGNNDGSGAMGHVRFCRPIGTKPCTTQICPRLKEEGTF